MSSRDEVIARYDQHVDDVKSAVAPERRLVYSVDQGWEPLCAFLGVAVPETPFPNVNDRAQIKQTIRDMTRGAYTILGLGSAVRTGLLCALGFWLV